jgi:hypothetical protein
MTSQKGSMSPAIVAALALGLAVIAGCAYYVMRQSDTPRAQDVSVMEVSNTHELRDVQNAGSDTDVAPGRLPVVALKTESGQGVPDTYVYPRTASFPMSDSYGSQLGAYGAAGTLWLGLRGWTGTASEGVDGNTTVALYPEAMGEAGVEGISYATYPACLSCILNGAAPFFPEAARALKEQYGDTPYRLSELAITRVSDSVVTYSYRNDRGTMAYGAASYIDASDPYFQRFEIVVKPERADVAAHLAQLEGEALANGKGLDLHLR